MSDIAANVKTYFLEVIPRIFVPDKVKGATFAIQYHITGEGAGDYVLEIKDDKCTTHEGKHESPKLAITIEGPHILALADGSLSGHKAFMTGKLKSKGSMLLAMKMDSLFPPTKKV
ncbi:MAG: SCP2 sterol-binding domain-containing protein [Polyangiaceae bacterium]